MPGSVIGLRALVTSGPTQEPLDPVRYLSNRSSGRQGHAIAEALAKAGAEVTLVSGPVMLPDPPGVRVVHVRTALHMLAACEAALPVDVAVCAAAVADWRAREVSAEKLKKNGAPPVIELVENPDILKTLASHAHCARLLVGFAAETGELRARARAKREAKGCDWILANDVSGGRGFDAEDNEVLLITAEGEEAWPRMSKRDVAARLADKIAAYFNLQEPS